MNRLIIFIFCTVFAFAIIFACTKDKGRNSALAYTDFGLRDSCRNSMAFVYYKNDPVSIYPGTNGPHGTFKLKFNHQAYSQLIDNGKLPLSAKFTSGSMIVKEILSGGNLIEYAVMYKRNDSWIWAEFTPDLKTIKHSVNAPASVCTGCHSQAGNRDFVTTFIFH